MIETMDAGRVVDADAGPDRTADTGLLGLVLLARFHGLAADPEQLVHQFKAPGEAFGDEQILLAARSLGLKARRVQSEFARLDRVPLPALAADKRGGYFILARVDGEQALIQHPGEARPQVLGRAELDRKSVV